ncbi:hypothetical protein FOZ63_003596 [Perkinsus olseni]|uniref:SNF2 N-terminal domain-containing protein n=1 Tax=Perkinsus olseni TaxID=32597 RepID=A0A7J6R0D8_PEROL|nr:hypothetical protein FOZ63_003596 [Perkinsus olseni]
MRARHSGSESIRRISEPNSRSRQSAERKTGKNFLESSSSSSERKPVDLLRWMRGEASSPRSPVSSGNSGENLLSEPKSTGIVLGEINTFCMCTRPMSAGENRMKPGKALNLTCTFKEPKGVRRTGGRRKTVNLGDRVLRGTAIARLSQPQLSPPSNEVGNLPGSIAQVLSPLVMLDLGLSVTARVGALAAYAGVIGGPVRMGDNIPITLTVMVDSHGLKATTDRRHLARYFEVAADQEGVYDKLRDCWWSLLTDGECLALKPTRAASWNIGDAKAASSPETESLASPSGEGTEDEEVDEAEGEMSAQMQEVLKARDGSTEYLARLNLPGMYPPSGVMACELKPYQAQALGWMMKREWPAECGGLPEEAIALYADAVDAHETAEVEKSEVTLHPSWAEFPTKDPNTKLYLHASRAEASVEFPGAAPDCLGGILADEMGLGKTIMALSLIATDRWLLDQGVELQPKASGKVGG